MKAMKDKRIRQLCAKENMRLMAFTDKDYEAMREAGLSDIQIVHMAGDSICVNVLMAIFGKMLGQEDKEIEEGIKGYIRDLKNVQQHKDKDK